jgi:hypothetical protein
MPHADVPAQIYEYWLFSSRLDFNSPDWVFELQSAGKDIPHLFTPRFPFIRFSERGARIIAVDHDGKVLAERVEVWKDSDSRRGALCQFNIEGPDVELSMMAVLTLFLHSVYLPPIFD